MTRWYYLLGGEVERGPVTTEALMKLRREGKVHPDTPVRKEEKRSSRSWTWSYKKKGSKKKKKPRKRWTPYYRTIPSDENRFDTVGLFLDLPLLPLERQALSSLLASLDP